MIHPFRRRRWAVLLLVMLVAAVGIVFDAGPRAVEWALMTADRMSDTGRAEPQRPGGGCKRWGSSPGNITRRSASGSGLYRSSPASSHWTARFDYFPGAETVYEVDDRYADRSGPKGPPKPAALDPASARRSAGRGPSITGRWSANGDGAARRLPWTRSRPRPAGPRPSSTSRGRGTNPTDPDRCEPGWPGRSAVRGQPRSSSGIESQTPQRPPRRPIASPRWRSREQSGRRTTRAVAEGEAGRPDGGVRAAMDARGVRPPLFLRYPVDRPRPGRAPREDARRGEERNRFAPRAGSSRPCRTPSSWSAPRGGHRIPGAHRRQDAEELHPDRAGRPRHDRDHPLPT